MDKFIRILQKYKLLTVVVLIAGMAIIAALNADTISAPTITAPAVTTTIAPVITATAVPTAAATAVPIIDPTQAAEDSRYDYDLYSLDFLDDMNGWVILWNYNDPLVRNKTSLLHTADGGAHWETYENQDCLLQKAAFADPEVGWAIALEGHPGLSDGSIVTYQILRTTDGGKNWSLQYSCSAEYGISCEIAVYDKGSACAVIGGQVYRTEDSGENWNLVERMAAGFTAEHVFFANETQGWISGVIKTGGSSKVDTAADSSNHYTVSLFHTADGGRSWQQQFSEDCKNEWNETIGISFADAKNGWFLTCNYGTFDGELYHTRDGGIQWDRISKLSVCRPYAQKVEAVTPEVLWIPMHNGAGPIDGGLLHSEDGGKNFNMLGSEADIVNSNDVDFVSASLGWAVSNGYPGEDKYLIRTVDGGKTWEKVLLIP